MNSCDKFSVFETAFPFWKGLPPAEQEYMCQSTAVQNYKRGDRVHDGGNECTGVILVKSGCLQFYILSYEGKEVTLYRLFPGQMCMLSASCVLQAITFDIYVDAEEDSSCFVIAPAALQHLIDTYPDAKIFALETAVDRFSDVMWIIQQILFLSVDRRLAIFLLDEAARLGSDTINLTHEQIARYMGSAREVVSRTLKYFAAEGFVESSRKGVKILNKKALGKLAL